MNKDTNTISPVQWIVRLAVLIAITIAFQMFRFPQFITGPFVNMMLLLTVLVLGIWGGVALGLATPLIAFFVGIMSNFTVVPIIMVANVVFVVVFALFRMKSVTFFKSFAGMLLGSILKFGAFAFALAFVVQLPDKVAQMLLFPQLLTAISGGVLALLVEKALQHTKLIQH